MRGRNQQEITAIKTSIDSNLFWKKYFRKNPVYFEIYTDFETDKEIDNSRIGNKTITIF